MEERGGYTVQPVPAPLSTMLELSNNMMAGGNSQNLMLFKRGKAISGAPRSIGTSQLPKPPIMVGITKKKIMMNACAVTITLYNWSSFMSVPALPNSKRINILIAVPKKADQKPKRKYNVPMSL